MLRCLIYFKRSFCSGNEREGPFSAGIVFRAPPPRAGAAIHTCLGSLTRHRHHSHQPARTCARAALSRPAHDV